jgi:hypothetical protein
VKFWWKKYKILGEIFISTSDMKNLEKFIFGESQWNFGARIIHPFGK